MAHDTDLEARLNQVWLHAFPKAQARTEVKKMFGGLSYLYRGKMTVGILGRELVVRIPPQYMEEVLEQEPVRPMDFNGRAMKEFVYVAEDGLQKPEDLAGWIRLGLEHAREQLSETPIKKRK